VEIEVAASAVGKKKFYIDVTNWEKVERHYRPFLVNAGWPQGLTNSVRDIKSYMEEIAQIYKEAVEAAGRASRDFVKNVARVWPLRFILPTRLEIGAEALREARGYWEIKTHIENVLGKKFHAWGEVYTGRVAVEIKNGVVYIGGTPSLGHTYLQLIGVFTL